MKNICLILAAVLMIVVISLPAFAAEEPVDPSDPETETIEETDPGAADPSLVDNPVVEDGTTEVAADDEVTENSEEVSDSDTYTDDGSAVLDGTGTTEVPVIQYGTQTSVRDMIPHSSDYTSSLMGAIFAVFGEYTPRTYMVTTYLDDGTAVTSTEIVPGLAGLDYNWIAGVVLFTLSLFCIFRMIGGLFRWK